MIEKRTQQRNARRHQLQVGTHVGQQLDADGEQLAVGVGRELDVLDLATALDRGLGGLHPLLGPADRVAELACEHDADELFGVDVELRAEASTDRRRDDAQARLRHPGRHREHGPQDVGDLRG